MRYPWYQSELGENVRFRDYAGLEPTEWICGFENYNDRGYVNNWIARIVYDRGDHGSASEQLQERWDNTPIIELYSAESNQFISSYYCPTFLEDKNGNALSLDGGVPAWTLTYDDLGEIQDWVGEYLDEIGFNWEMYGW